MTETLAPAYRPEASGPDGSTGPTARRFRAVGAFVAVLVVAVAATFVVVGRSDGHPAGDAPLDLAVVPHEIAGHYHYAQAHSDAYRQIPCWCGCQQFLGHRNLEDCFVRPAGGWQAHAAGCGVCIGESAIAQRMLEGGQTAADVGRVVNTEFGTTAITVPRS